MRISLGSVMSTFTKTIQKLEKFTEQCDADIQLTQAQIDEAEQKKNVFQSEREQATKSLDKLRDIVG